MELLKIGQKISIFFQKGSDLIEIVCSITDLYEDRIVMDLPQYFMRYIEFLEVGCRLTAKVFSQVGTVDFNTIVISSPLEDEFSVEYDTNAMKLTASEDIPVINAMESLNLTKNEIPYKVNTFELSTEFLKFYCDSDFQEGDVFACELNLPKNYGIIKFNGTISEVDEVYDNEYTMVYSSMTEEARQNLLYYMYMYSNDTV